MFLKPRNNHLHSESRPAAEVPTKTERKSLSCCLICYILFLFTVNQLSWVSAHRQVQLLEKLADGHVLLSVLLHNLGNGHLKVFLRDVNSSLSESEHTSLGTDRL
jgi:hypothetical protein